MENKELNNENIQSNNPVQSEQPNFSQIFNVESEEQQPVQQVQTEETEQPRRHISASFNGQEEVLHTIEEEKDKSPIVPLILILGLVGIIILLPVISKRVEFNVFDPETVPVNPNTTNPEDELYEFNKSSVRAKIGQLEFTNFVKSKEHNEYLLSFTVNNVGDRSYDFSKKYYIVLKEGNKTIYRALIHSYDGLGALSATTLSVKLTKSAYNNANRFKIEEIPTASYPENVRTVNMEGDYNVLTCSYNNSTIKYYFLENELHKIYDEHNEAKETDGQINEIYEQNKSLYLQLSNKYKNVENFSSIFIETETDFRMINEIDLKQISAVTMAQLRTYRFFKYKESIKIVSFEMEAQGYKCG